MADLASTRVFGKLTVMHEAIVKANAEVVGNVTAAKFIGDGSQLTSLPWGQLTGVPSTFAPSSHSHAAGDLPNASTSAKGVVQLNNTTTSTSTVQAATANAVKTANDAASSADSNANSRVAKAGDTLTGTLTSNIGASTWVEAMRTPLLRSTIAVGNSARTLVSGRVDAGYFGLSVNRDAMMINFITTENYDSSTNSSINCLRVDTAGNVSAFGTLSGNGAGLTSLNASNISTGTVADARLPSTAVRISRTITAGSGLSGGGTLADNRTISLGTPGTLSGSTTNAVTAESHTHVISSTDSRTSSSTAALLQAKAMNDHRTSGDHDGRYVNRAGDSMGGVLAFGIPDSKNRKVLELGYGYDVYVDTGAGAGSANNRLWFDAPNGGEVVIGPRAGSPSLHRIRMRGNVTLDGRFQYSGNGSGLTSLNASNLSTGTVADARLPSTAVRTSRTITAGNGLSGGGDLSANRTITLGTPGSITAASTNSVTATSHTHAINLSASDVGAPPTSRSISAGNGLTGGGDLAANRTITLGTPGSITATSSNSVTATSHTHAISEGTIRTLISKGAAGALGTYAYLWDSQNRSTNQGQTRPGSELRFAGGTDEWPNYRNSSPPGTWMAMGVTGYRDGSLTPSWSRRTTLWLRIS